LTAPDGVARFVSDLSLPRDSDGPVFVEPWQAQAFALTVRLHAAGCFTWTEWVDTLAGVLREVRKRGEPDDGSHYYAHWLVALERLVTAKQVLDADTLGRRKQPGWRRTRRRRMGSRWCCPATRPEWLHQRVREFRLDP
jgi:nitrile hydratase accessory protein